MSKTTIVLASLLVLAICGVGSSWWPSFAGTHDKITEDALDDLSASQYPDLLKFADELRAGSATEAHAPPSVPGSDPEHPHRWFPDPEHWWGYENGDKPCALERYERYEFAGTYETIGYMLHNKQDLCVPAHIMLCIHTPTSPDSLEGWVAAGNHDYSSGSTPWSWFDTTQGTWWYYWLDDEMDDDDEDPSNQPDGSGGGGDIVDHGGQYDSDWFDPPDPGEPDLRETIFGTYGYGYGDDGLYDDACPGKNEGRDRFSSEPTPNIAYEQLQEAFDDTLYTIKAKSEALPPIIPGFWGSLEGYSPLYITEDIFGPELPVQVSFTAMENRKKTVKVSITASGSAIKDIGGSVWDGGSGATYDLAECTEFGELPWKDEISRTWQGALGSGELSDGTHTIEVQIEDEDGNSSNTRTRTVKYDATEPTASIETAYDYSS